MVNAQEYAEQAYSYKDSHIPYSTLDCQAFCEKVLSDLGEKHNWRGSNHMWRSALSWRGTIAECIKKYGCVPAGAWVFVVKNDGGEKERGYNDNDGNASHVAIYTALGKTQIMESTTGGVQECKNPNKFTHVGFCKFVDFFPAMTEDDIDKRIKDLTSEISVLFSELEGLIEKRGDKKK